MARRLLLLAFILGITVAASATKIQTSDPNCDKTTTINSGDFFSFNALANGEGVFCFVNNTGSTWKDLLIAIQTKVPLRDQNNNPQITCGWDPTEFLYCLLDTNPSNPDVIYAYFANPCAFSTCSPTLAGVPDGKTLYIDLNCKDGGACVGPESWGPNAGVNTYTNVTPPPNFGVPNLPPFKPVPEPTTIALLGSGLGAVYLKRRRRK